MERPLILITNDDSVEAPGFHHLIECVKEFGDVIGIAPASPHSGQSSAISVNTPLRITPVERYSTDEVPVYHVNGTPVDCVKLGMHAVVPRRPSLVLAGINHGSNSGVNVVYSGTMGAVLEGCMVGIPAVGFSLLHHSLKADFSETTPFVKSIVKHVLDNGLPERVCLNVNIPAKCKPVGMKVTRAARGYWTEEYARYDDPHGKPFYWLTGHFHNLEPDNPETDEYWLERKWVTVVPTTPDMTALGSLGTIENILGI